jgi:hypothetical protein
MAYPTPPALYSRLPFWDSELSTSTLTRNRLIELNYLPNIQERDKSYYDPNIRHLAELQANRHTAFSMYIF